MRYLQGLPKESHYLNIRIIFLTILSKQHVPYNADHLQKIAIRSIKVIVLLVRFQRTVCLIIAMKKLNNKA